MAIPIRAALTITTKTFTKGISAATKGVGIFVGIVSKAALVIAGLTAAFAAVVLRQAAYIDRIGKVSKVTGVAAETLQKFSFAAELAGVSTDQAQVALRRFSRRLGEAQKNTGELAPTLRRLGIDIRNTDGSFKSAEEVLLNLSDAIANTDDKSQQLAIAFKAFDSEGAELVNVLSQGSDAMEALFTRAEALGGVLSGSAIQGVEDFNDSMTELRTLIGGLVNQFTAALAPALERITDDLVKFALKIGEEFGGIENIGEALALGLIDAIKSIVVSFATLQEATINFINDFKNMTRGLGFGDLSNDAQFLQNALDLVNDRLKEIPRSGGKPLDRLAAQLSTLEFGFETIGKAIDNNITTLDTTDLNLLADAMENIQQVFFETDETLSAFGQKQQIKVINDDLKLAAELIKKGLGAGVFNADQLEVDLNWLSQTLQVLAALRTEIMMAGEEQEKNTDEVEEQLTFYQKLVAFIEKAGKNVKDFREDTVDFVTLLENVSTRLGTPIERLQKTLEDGLVKGVEMFEDALTEAVLTGKLSFSDLGDHLKATLAKAMVQKFISGPILALFGLADGGPAKAGQPYIVGEEGPELFVPNQSGTVIPNDVTEAMSGGSAFGGGNMVTYNINAVDAPSFQQLVASDPQFIYAVTQAGARTIPGSR